MKWNNLFRINVGFLIHEAVGAYREFEIEAPSLNLEDDFEVENVHCLVRVNRVQQGILASIHITAETQMECVRCLESFPQKIESNFDELFAFHLRQNADADLYLPENGVMDILPLIREYQLIEIPICPICKPECKGLCAICGTNLNSGTCEHQQSQES